MSLEVYLQTFKCLSRLDAGILWLGLIGQCTNFEVLTLYTIREKTNLTKPTLRPVKCKYVVYTQKLTCMYSVKFDAGKFSSRVAQNGAYPYLFHQIFLPPI